MERKIIDLTSRHTCKDKIDFGPKGEVEIFVRNKYDNALRLLSKGNNLILYQGREWLVQRVVNLSRVSGTDMEQRFVSWIGLGSGGATMDDPFNPIAPQLDDTELANIIVINSSKPQYADGGKKVPVQIEFLQDSDNDNRWLIARLTSVIAFDDCVGSFLNEAGLYVSTSNVPGSASGFLLFARHTFSTIEKTEDREITIRWSLYF